MAQPHEKEQPHKPENILAGLKVQEKSLRELRRYL
eukprot:CAMPEP_0197610536 /NCGR_PEP_ID=MMETSP1326-20131121/53586_1 /TAXON_ID=1155430 /ORGANISM="Genus nov. species nov., Strain RCC2288" /LENGTH=34 /DNA_ID= /DNA_START= /DNA_END= /DNA_ORIENTATION=